MASLRERAAARTRLRGVSLKLPPFLKLQKTGGPARARTRTMIQTVPPARVRDWSRSRSDYLRWHQGSSQSHRLAEYPDPVPTKDLKR